MRGLPAGRQPTLLLLVAALLAGCGIGSGRDEALGQALEAAIGSAPDNGVVDLTTLVPGPWDEVVVFDPGTPASRMRDDLGLDWPAADAAASTLENEDVETLVFLSGGKVTTWAAMWITHGEIPFGRWQASAADGSRAAAHPGVIGATDRFPGAKAPLIGATDQNDVKRHPASPKPVDLIGPTDHSRVGRAESIGATDHRRPARRRAPPPPRPQGAMVVR